MSPLEKRLQEQQVNDPHRQLSSQVLVKHPPTLVMP